MATSAITVNDYTKPKGCDGTPVINTAQSFNANPVSSFCRNYIGTSRSCSRDLIKKIPSGVEGISYTIHFSIVKSGMNPAQILYIFSSPEGVIISSQQEYSNVADFTADINFIDKTISDIFS